MVNLSVCGTTDRERETVRVVLSGMQTSLIKNKLPWIVILHLTICDLLNNAGGWTEMHQVIILRALIVLSVLSVKGLFSWMVKDTPQWEGPPGGTQMFPRSPSSSALSPLRLCSCTWPQKTWYVVWLKTKCSKSHNYFWRKSHNYQIY